MTNDDDVWRWMKDDDGRVERAAVDAVKATGRSDSILWVRRGIRRGSGGTDPACNELWSVQFSDVEGEIRECVAVTDRHAEVVAKFAGALQK